MTVLLSPRPEPAFERALRPRSSAEHAFGVDPLAAAFRILRDARCEEDERRRALARLKNVCRRAERRKGTRVEKPEMCRVKARDVVPYHWALWCSIEDGKPFANEIVHVSWSDDGERIWFGLETHNAFSAGPDEEVELVPHECSMSADLREDVRKRHAKVIADRPRTREAAEREANARALLARWAGEIDDERHEEFLADARAAIGGALLAARENREDG